jgi:hypothetical protein
VDISLDYTYRPRQRAWDNTRGVARLRALFEARTPDFIRLLQDFGRFRPNFEAIALRNAAESLEPCWINDWIPGLDSASIYGLLALNNPSVYLEVGSGYSTKFARQAIRDHGLQTKIVSIDPQPRANIDQLCDQVIRAQCEDIEEGAFANLPADTVLFVDNSHRAFQNSDVTVFFTEILPALPKGVIWGLHDIYLPDDYPLEWGGRYWNEQYLLMTYLLGGAADDLVLMPNAYLSRHPVLSASVNELFAGDALRDVSRGGGCFWMQRT